MKRFPLDKNYAALLHTHGISVEELLKRAQLPSDLFLREHPCVNSGEYYRFMKAIEDLVQDPSIPVALATEERIETISPPIFAAYCSANAKECIQRMAQYKALAGAVRFDIGETDEEITGGLF